MKKMKLDLETLAVDSFDTVTRHGRGGDGTVVGQSVDQEPVTMTDFGISCANGSCWITCIGTCWTWAPVLQQCVLGACSQPDCNPALTVDC